MRPDILKRIDKSIKIVSGMALFASAVLSPLHIEAGARSTTEATARQEIGNQVIALELGFAERVKAEGEYRVIVKDRLGATQELTLTFSLVQGITNYRLTDASGQEITPEQAGVYVSDAWQVLEPDEVATPQTEKWVMVVNGGSTEVTPNMWELVTNHVIDLGLEQIGDEVVIDYNQLFSIYQVNGTYQVHYITRNGELFTLGRGAEYFDTDDRAARVSESYGIAIDAQQSGIAIERTAYVERTFAHQSQLEEFFTFSENSAGGSLTLDMDSPSYGFIDFSQGGERHQLVIVNSPAYVQNELDQIQVYSIDENGWLKPVEKFEWTFDYSFDNEIRQFSFEPLP